MQGRKARTGGTGRVSYLNQDPVSLPADIGALYRSEPMGSGFIQELEGEQALGERCLTQTLGSRRTALARVLRPFGLQPLQLADHVPCPLNRDLNALVILRQLVQLGQVTGPIHDAGVWAGLVGDHYVAHGIGIVPHRWRRFEARRYIRRSTSEPTAPDRRKRRDQIYRRRDLVRKQPAAIRRLGRGAAMGTWYGEKKTYSILHLPPMPRPPVETRVPTLDEVIKSLPEPSDGGRRERI